MRTRHGLRPWPPAALDGPSAKARALAPKLAAAFPRGEQAELTERILRDINRKIGDYLAIKTLINVIVATISFVILWGMGVDFALFWAVVIGLFNYIPYVGSIIGVALPVVLSLAQFGSFGTTAVLAGLLMALQMGVRGAGPRGAGPGKRRGCAQLPQRA
jgi:predicted PurR-regulated permease PerM